jgi:hypothetical protein
MLRVAAYTCGRSAVNEYDTLLLQHVLWQRPEEAERIRDWLLQRIVKDRGTQQVRHRHRYRAPCGACVLTAHAPHTRTLPFLFRFSSCSLGCTRARVAHKARRRTAARLPPRL